MNHCMLARYQSILEMEFRNIDGAVLASPPGTAPRPWHRPPVTPEDRAMYENETNHQHFDYPIGDTVWVRWQNNLTLALSVQQFWRVKLREFFPDREFTMFIYNELAVVWEPEPDQSPIEIHPALRMWSRCNDPEGEMFRAFCVDQARPDTIETRENSRPTFIPASAVFTKKRQVRKDFLAQVAHAREQDRL